MINSTFFYWAACVFEVMAAVLVALMVGEAATEGTVPLFRKTAALLVFPFLIAAMIHAWGWVMHLTGALGPNDPYAHFSFVHARVRGVLHWLGLGAVFAPLLLWIPALRALPQAVLVIAGIAISPWVGSMLGY